MNNQLISQIEVENKKLRARIHELKKNKNSLEKATNQITTSRAYKLWQKYNDIKKNKLYLPLLKFHLKEQIKYLLLKYNLNYQNDGYEIINTNKRIIAPKNTSKEEFISVVIHTCNTPNTFETTLFNYTVQTGVTVEIIVIDSGSTDNTLSLAKKYGCKIIKIKPSEFLHGKTRNIGIQAAKGNFIVNTVADALPSSSKLLLDTYNFIKNNNLSAASIRQIPYYDADYFAQWIIYNHYRYLFPNGNYNVVIKKASNFNKLSPEQQRRLCVLDDVFTMHKASVIKKNLYSKTIEYAEDLEYSKRLLLKDHKIGFLNSIAIIHSHNRIPTYFLKRYFVDTIGINNIMDIKPNNYSFITKGPNIKSHQYIYSLFLSFLNNYITLNLKPMSNQHFKSLSDIETIINSDKELLYIRELMSNIKISTMDFNIYTNFNTAFNYLLNNFKAFLQLSVEDEEEIAKIMKATYKKILYMNLGIGLGELFIHNSRFKDPGLTHIKNSLFDKI